MFLGFDDVYSFIGFITSILYNLIPLAFIYQLKSGVLKKERISIIALLSLYCNCFLYFFVSVFQYVRKDQSVNPMDFCNLIGAYLGFVYLILYIYYVYCKENRKKARISIITLIVSSIAFFFLVSFTIGEENNFWSYLFKYLGVIFNILQNLPLGFNIIYLLKNKISEKYTLFGAFFGLLNTVTWFIWAFQAVFFDKNNHDKPYQTLVANLIAICLNITKFFLFFKYRKEEDEDTGTNLENNLSQSINEDIKSGLISTNNSSGEKNEKREESDIIDEFM